MVNNMISNNAECRVALDEVAREGHAGQHDADGAPYHNTPDEIIADQVAEIMSDRHTNDDARVFLMESERFTKALWTHFAKRHDGSCPEDTEASVNLNSIAETVLKEWLEKSL